MAEESLYDDRRIAAKEEVEILPRAFDEADKGGLRKRTDILERLERGIRLVEEGYFDGLCGQDHVWRAAEKGHKR